MRRLVHRSTPQNRPKDPDNLTPDDAISNQPIGQKIRHDVGQAGVLRKPLYEEWRGR
jgi:hypothetical protein